MSNSGPQPPFSPHPAAEPIPPRLFAGPPPPERSNRAWPLIAAVIGVLVLAAGALLLRSGHTAKIAPPTRLLPPDAYASNLRFTELKMSQSTSLSGGASTFIDGRVKNAGSDTLSGITMQVLFRNDVDLPPQIYTLPLTLIRTHEPYVDIEPVSVAPLKPGDEVEFRLIFENVTGSWNQQIPELVAVQVAKR